jgi:hypothetical protein
MNNLKLKNKIVLMLALPIFIILVLSTSSIFDKVEKEINDNIVTTPIKLLHAQMKNHAGFIGAVALAELKGK